MADIPELGFRKYWRQELSSLKSECHAIMNKYPEAASIAPDDFQEVKRCKRCISNGTSETAKKLTKSVPISTAVKQIPKAVPTHNFFSPLRTNDMDTETNGAVGCHQ
jgi:hypothetical protein